MLSLNEIGLDIINTFSPLHPILKFVITMTITMWSIIFNPFNWLGIGSTEATNEESCKEENLNQQHSDGNIGELVTEIEANTNSPPPITTSDESHYLIHDSFCTSKSRFVPSGEHFKGTNAFVAELKLLHQQMKLKSLEKLAAGNPNIDEDDLTTIMPIPKPRKSLLAKRSYSSVVQVQTDNNTPPVPSPRGKAVAKA